MSRDPKSPFELLLEKPAQEEMEFFLWYFRFFSYPPSEQLRFLVSSGSVWLGLEGSISLPGERERVREREREREWERKGESESESERVCEREREWLCGCEWEKECICVCVCVFVCVFQTGSEWACVLERERLHSSVIHLSYMRVNMHKYVQRSYICRRFLSLYVLQGNCRILSKRKIERVSRWERERGIDGERLEKK